MTEKIRLKDGTEFELIPMGIENKDKLRLFKIVSDLPAESIAVSFKQPNIERIEYILADDSIGAVYEDCVAFKFITFVPSVQIYDNAVDDIYIVAVSTDPVERELLDANGKMQATIGAVDMLLTEFLPMILN